MHILRTKDFLDRKTLEDIFQLAQKMENEPDNKLLADKILATVFYEPSTRTRFSFEAAMLKLGGQVITTENAAQFSSAFKGESLEDTIRIIGSYADAIVLRHPEEGAAEKAASVSQVPIINGGDGAGDHPTQGLLDIYTIQKEMGRVDNLEVAMIGDLRNSRTMHSLANFLGVFDGIKIRLVSPRDLALPEGYKEYLRERKVQFDETEDVDQVLETTDVFSVVRVQKERFSDPEEYDRLKQSFARVINPERLEKIKSGSIIMHVMPRVDEIDPAVDQDPRAAYFRQAKNGLFTRMALLAKVFGKA